MNKKVEWNVCQDGTAIVFLVAIVLINIAIQNENLDRFSHVQSDIDVLVKSMRQMNPNITAAPDKKTPSDEEVAEMAWWIKSSDGARWINATITQYEHLVPDDLKHEQAEIVAAAIIPVIQRRMRDDLRLLSESMKDFREEQGRELCVVRCLLDKPGTVVDRV